MKIVIVRRVAQSRQVDAGFPRIVLERGIAWDDAGYETLFDVYFVRETGVEILLGSTKLLAPGWTPEEHPTVLDKLPEGSCSLGQTIDYYRAIEEEGKGGDALLLAICDVTTFTRDAADRCVDKPGFKESLLRFPEAARIFDHHLQGVGSSGLAFRFRAKLNGFDEPHEVDFDFSSKPKSIGRLMAIVGRSGSGKTQLLARLAACLWGLSRPGEEITPRRPPIGRVIAVSYSALDVFERPPHRSADFSERPAFDNYRYVGFRDTKGALRPDLLFEAMEKDLIEIDAWSRAEMLRKGMIETGILRDEPPFEAALNGGRKDVLDVARHLGAGQKTALSALTALLATIREGSFVVFDEPETHLHPSLLAGVLRVLHDWLEHFDAFGVVATHSPVVLQEIPGGNVRVIERVGRSPIVRRYPAESFGQSLSEIVDEVFGAAGDDKNFVKTLAALLDDGMSAKEVEEAFGRPLSLNARMALRYLTSARDGVKGGGGDASA